METQPSSATRARSALGEADDVGDVRVDVVRHDEVGRPVLLANLRAGLGIEERG